MRYRLLALALAAFPAAAMTQISSVNWDATATSVKAACHRIGLPRPPAADRPSPARIRALKGCDAEALYYGEGMKPDYVKARHCAFAQAQSKTQPVFGGEVMLMQIYANGHGVTRDLDLATAYACRIDGAPMENQGRVTHLQSLKTRPGSFDYCDDITSGLAQGECQSRSSNQAAARRDSRLRGMLAGFPLAARPLYPPLAKAFDEFVDAHGGGEVDLTGTARAALVIAEEDSTRDQFRKDLDRLRLGQWPAGNARADDTQLNAAYRKALLWAAGKDNLTTTKPEDIRKAQRAWLTYRDAYVRFAAVAAPGTPGDAVLARLTRLRSAQLDDLSRM